MKRVLAKTKWSEPKPLPKTNTRNKDVFGSDGKPPFYDPYEDHIHLWKVGYKIPQLRFLENPFSETRSKMKIQHHQLLARFCSICHKPRRGLDQVLMTPSGSISKEEASDIIDCAMANKVEHLRIVVPTKTIGNACKGIENDESTNSLCDELMSQKSKMPTSCSYDKPVVRWTLEEEEKLSDLHDDYGNKWKFIQTFFQNRSALQLERHWYSMNKPRARDVPWLRDDPDIILDNYYQLKKK